MTITQVEALETKMSRDSSYSYTRTNIFRVRSDDAWEDPKDVIFAAAGGPYDSSASGSTLKPVDPERQTWTWGVSGEVKDVAQEVTDIQCANEIPMGQKIGDRRLWIVTLTYADYLFERPGQSQSDATKVGDNLEVWEPRLTPLDEPAKFSGSFFSTEEWRSLTKDGAAIVNSAEQPYPEQRVSVDYDTILVERNLEFARESDRSAAVNTVNELAFWGLGARRVKFARWDYPGGVKYYTDAEGETKEYVKCVMEFHVNPDTWDVSHPDYGTMTIASAGNADPAVRYQTVDVKDTQSRVLPIPSNVLLDGSGAFDSTQTTVDDPANVSGPFELLTEVDFTSGMYAQTIPQELPEALGVKVPAG